jgi:uncharacterized protein (DUF2141 family)
MLDRKKAVMMYSLAHKRKRIVCAVLLCASFAVSIQCYGAQAKLRSASDYAEATASLTVVITGVRNANGKIRLALYQESKLSAFRLVDIDVHSLTATVVFNRLSQGVYAVYVFHDENMDGRLNANFFGIPTEGYGMSNNPRKRAGKPGFDETDFHVNPPATTIEIKMIYWK